VVATVGPVEGVDETAAAFDKLRDDVRDMPATHDKIARARLGSVARLTPVRTGELRGSWDTEPTSSGSSIVSPLAYAPVIEYGSAARGISAVGMVQRTLEADATKIADEYAASILEAGRRRGFPIE
jgi:hypothetical protein